MRYCCCRNFSKAGVITIAANEKGILAVRFGDFRSDFDEERKTPMLQEACDQLEDYFQGNRRCFDLPLMLEGTAFQKQVWQALLEIPYGETATYGQIAEKIGNPKAARAVGMANHNNPIAIIVPCHRVIGANGSLTGYAGGLNQKAMLLELEASVCDADANR